MLKNLQKNVLLKNYTTFKIGGPAKYFLKAKTKKELINAIKWAKEHELQFFILGGGSNLLVADKGYEGMVIKLQIANCKLQIASGTKLGDLVKLSLKKGLTGLEWAAGIPGTIGGAIRGNAEAFGVSMGKLVKKIEVYDAKKKKIKIFNNQNCKFKYKNSIFKENPDLIILSSEIKLKKGVKKDIKKRISDNLDYRAKNHPLNFPSAGCTFKNHKLRIMNYELLEQFPELKELNKKNTIPAGWLIEKCGLKGRRVGRAEVSQKHSNFIISAQSKSTKQTSTKDVVNLIKLIKKKVKEKFKIELKEEIQYLGF
jgi:UDP-N-acetylmuramate dehydrogenase